jgi:CheY-like chemotaxis protein
MILYVEDNQTNQRLFQKLMSRWNIPLMICSTAEEGYEAILCHQPELIFMDVHLRSRITGLDLVKKLRTEGLETPIIVTTAFSMLASREQAMEVGCDDYLTKPYSIDELRRVIGEYIPDATLHIQVGKGH